MSNVTFVCDADMVVGLDFVEEAKNRGIEIGGVYCSSTFTESVFQNCERFFAFVTDNTIIDPVAKSKIEMCLMQDMLTGKSKICPVWNFTTGSKKDMFGLNALKGAKYTRDDWFWRTIAQLCVPSIPYRRENSRPQPLRMNIPVVPSTSRMIPQPPPSQEIHRLPPPPVKVDIMEKLESIQCVAAAEGGAACTICMTNVPNIAFIECGHMTCRDCVLGLIKKGMSCHTCRKPITDVIKIYY